MQATSIIGRPNLNLNVLRSVCKAVLDRDLSTVIKGITEPLAVLSLLITEDEYIQPSNCQRHLHYTILLVTPDWVLFRLKTIFDRCTFINEQTLKSDIYLSIVTGSLSDFITPIKEHSYHDQVADVLETLNSLQSLFENEGYVQLFKEFTKQKVGIPFYLKKK